MEGGILLYFSGTFYHTHCQSCLFPPMPQTGSCPYLFSSALEGHGLPLPEPSLVGIPPSRGLLSSCSLCSWLPWPTQLPTWMLILSVVCKDLVLQPYQDL